MQMSFSMTGSAPRVMRRSYSL